MKLGPVTKLDKRNKTTSKKKKKKKIDDGVMTKSCDIIAIFPVYSQFGAIWKPDSGWIVCKIYILIDNKLLSYKK